MIPGCGYVDAPEVRCCKQRYLVDDPVHFRVRIAKRAADPPWLIRIHKLNNLYLNMWHMAISQRLHRAALRGSQSEANEEFFVGPIGFVEGIAILGLIGKLIGWSSESRKHAGRVVS